MGRSSSSLLLDLLPSSFSSMGPLLPGARARCRTVAVATASNLGSMTNRAFHIIVTTHSCVDGKSFSISPWEALLRSSVAGWVEKTLPTVPGFLFLKRLDLFEGIHERGSDRGQLLRYCRPTWSAFLSMAAGRSRISTAIVTRAPLGLRNRSSLSEMAIAPGIIQILSVRPSPRSVWPCRVAT